MVVVMVMLVLVVVVLMVVLVVLCLVAARCQALRGRATLSSMHVMMLLWHARTLSRLHNKDVPPINSGCRHSQAAHSLRLLQCLSPFCHEKILMPSIRLSGADCLRPEAAASKGDVKEFKAQGLGLPVCKAPALVVLEQKGPETWLHKLFIMFVCLGPL